MSPPVTRSVIRLPADELRRTFESLKCVSRAEYYNTNSVRRELGVVKKRLKKLDAMFRSRNFNRSTGRNSYAFQQRDCPYCGESYRGVWVISHGPECKGDPPSHAWEQMRRPNGAVGEEVNSDCVGPMDALDDDHSERAAWRQSMVPDVAESRRVYDRSGAVTWDEKRGVWRDRALDTPMYPM